MEKFTPLAKFYTAAGTDGMDKFHLWASKLASCYSCYKRLVIWKLSINIIEPGCPTISSWMAQHGSNVYISCLIVIAPMKGVLCRFIEQPLMLMLEWHDWHNIFYPIAKDFFRVQNGNAVFDGFSPPFYSIISLGCRNEFLHLSCQKHFQAA